MAVNDGKTTITLTFDEVSAIQDALGYYYLARVDPADELTEGEREVRRHLRKAQRKIDRAYDRLEAR